MGREMPTSVESPREAAQALMQRKDRIEAEIKSQHAILQANGVTLQSPLVDADGFPRADIDIWAVRTARVRIIELRNDLAAITNEIGKALENVFAAGTKEEGSKEKVVVEAPFARVDSVAPDSPAAEAGMLKEDLIVKFGDLTRTALTSSSLQPLAAVVATNENVCSLASINELVLTIYPEEDIYTRLARRSNYGAQLDS
ncbi:hypothetical protein ONZ45_g10963 [Pleurotus djamor]|nr:hypothetical protein ONZ45_g10963 [Pleurotus djamor]